MQLKNPAGKLPVIDDSAYISESAVVIGNVKIGGNVYIAPNATIRADEPGSCITIGDGCNIQDNVVIHGLTDSQVTIGGHTSISHGCIIHGPCVLGSNCFVGFGSVLFNCIVGDGCFFQYRTLVRDVTISKGRVVRDGMVLNSQSLADSLPEVDESMIDFAKNVVNVNLMLAESYLRMER